MQRLCVFTELISFFWISCILPLFIQFFAVILHSHSKSPHAHRTFIALPSHTRARVAAMSPAGVTKAEACSISASRVPEAEACSSSASRVPKVGAADNRTEIISPANKQYKGRKSLAAF